MFHQHEEEDAAGKLEWLGDVVGLLGGREDLRKGNSTARKRHLEQTGLTTRKLIKFLAAFSEAHGVSAKVIVSAMDRVEAVIGTPPKPKEVAEDAVEALQEVWDILAGVFPAEFPKWDQPAPTTIAVPPAVDPGPALQG